MDHAASSKKYNLYNAGRLDPDLCPSFHSAATIKVKRTDTLNAALQLLYMSSKGSGQKHNWCPVIINFANGEKPGGGWLNGAMAQEESLCYRSSLYMSLDKRYYPLSNREAEAIYSPYVLVMRGDLPSGHRRMDVPPRELPVVSALSVAAIRNPPVRTFRARAPYGQRPREKHVFAHDRDRSLTKDKMRLVLRLAAYNRHRQLVLGALGCGVYKNPPEDIAKCWLEVLREAEFEGNWWTDVVFAIYDPKDDGNFREFYKILHGKKV